MSRSTRRRFPLVISLALFASVGCPSRWISPSTPLTWLTSQLVNSGIDPVRTVIRSNDDYKNKAHIYTDALAVIVFTHAGRTDIAQRILDTYWWIYTNSAGEGRDHSSGLLYDERDVNALVPALNKGKEGFRSGENAWLVMAINYYEVRTGDDSYAPFAVELLDKIIELREDVDTEPAYGAFRWNDLDPWNTWYSTEFQHDIYSALRVRAELSGDSDFEQYAEDLRNYLTYDVECYYPFSLCTPKPKVWLRWNDPVFNGELFDGDTTTYSDAQTWGVLSLFPPEPGEPDFYQALYSIDDEPGGNSDEDWSGCMRADVMCDGITTRGFKSVCSVDADYVQIEFTLFFVAASQLIGEPERAQYFLGSVEHLLSHGSLIHSCANDGTPIDWPENYRKPSVDATAWYYFVTHNINPFQPAAPPPVPSLSTPGMALLASPLLGAALLIRRRRIAGR